MSNESRAGEGRKDENAVSVPLRAGKSKGSTRAARFKQADISRAIRAVVAAGFTPCSCRCDPDGGVVVNFATESNPIAMSSNPWDEELLK